MSKDKIDISIATNFKTINKNINLWNRKRVKLDTKDSDSINSRIDYWIMKENIYIKYYNFSVFSGRLLISINMDKLIKETVNGLMTNIDINNIKDYLEDRVGDILDFNKISDVNSWGVTREETYIDIVVPEDVAEALYDVLLKTKSNRKKTDDEYADKGTIYYYSGTDRKKSKCLYKVYNKKKESKYRNKKVDCPVNNTVLRFEAKNGRTKIVRVVRNIRKDIINKSVRADNLFINICSDFSNYKCFKFNSGNEYILNGAPCILYYGVNLWNTYGNEYNVYNKEPSYSVLLRNLSPYATLSDTCDIRYKQKLLIDFMKDMQMDKEKVTRKELMKKMDLIFTTPKTRETSKKVIKYLNGEIKVSPISEKSILKYKKKILDSGVHYIYSSMYIPAIDIDCLRHCIYVNKRLELVA